MKRYFRHYLIGLVVALVIILSSVLGMKNVHAIETTLTVSPMEQKMTVYPGEPSKGSIKVSNQASAKETLYYKVSAVPFTRSGDGYNPMVGDELSGGDYNDIVKWVTFSSNSGALEPNEQDEIIYTVNVPEGTRGGGQYFAILVTRTENPNTNSEGNGLSLKEIIQIASTVYVTVSGEDIQLSGTIKDNKISTFFLRPPVTASFTVENTGNTHMEINYYMQVFPIFSDEEVYTNEENPSLAIVLPGTTRYVSQEWSDAPLVGIFKVRQVAMYSSNSEDKSVTEKIVIICPIWLAFIIVFVIAAIVIYLVMKAKSRKNSRKRIETE